MLTLGDQLHPTNVPSYAVVGGGNIGSTNELSPDAWSSHSSPHEIGDVNALAHSQREPHEDDHPQPERSTMVMDDATTGMDLQSDAEALGRPSSDIVDAIAAVAPSTMTTAGVVAIDDTEPHMHDGGNEGDGTSKSSKNKKEPIFLGGVVLVILDNCDVLDKRLLCDNEDTDSEEAFNWDDMDVDIGAPSCVQTIQPSSSTTLA